MTDNEIIKALEATASWVCDECKFHGEMCDGDKCEKVIAENALDLINRQKAEIDELNKVNALAKYQNEKICKLEDELRRAKSEISKFYEQSDSYCNEAIDVFADCLKIKLNRMIDNLVKEMTEVEE